MASVRSLDDFLPRFEFSERHAIDVAAGREYADRALRRVSVDDVPAIRALYLLRGLGRARRGVDRPLLGLPRIGAVMLEDVPGEGVVLGLTGQFWRLGGGSGLDRPQTADQFLAYSRADVCKAVIDFRIVDLGDGRCRLSTETRVHVQDPAARRAFRRYWRVVRPFSGLIRILFLRAVRRQARLM